MTAVALAVALLAAQASTGSGIIRGTVTNANSQFQQPLQDARLELTGGPDSPRITRTDSNGRFVFSNLPFGRYRLAVTRDGFIRQEYPKTISVWSDPKIPTVTFRLEPAPVVAGLILDELRRACTQHPRRSAASKLRRAR